MLAVTIRSDLFRFSGPAFTDSQLTALLAFLGVVLTVTVSCIGVFLSKVASDRSFAQQRADADRQTLETAVQVLELLKVEGGLANRVVTAGALTTLVYLRQSVIAMQMLRVALDENAVDIRTAVWLVDRILSEPPTLENRAQLDASKHNAAELLSEHVADLTNDANPGMAEWPTSALAAWPANLSVQCSRALLMALVDLLSSRSASWWTQADRTWSWVVYTLYELALETTAEPELRQEAAGYATSLLMVLPAYAEVDGLTDSISQLTVTEELDRIGLAQKPDEIQLPVELARWIHVAGNSRP
jgi:hypothetical protein